jgi:hypothetical protein
MEDIEVTTYEKTEWKAREGTNLNRFQKLEETQNYVVLQNQPTNVSQPGTPFSAQNMNKIEQGIFDAHKLAAIEERDRKQADEDTLSAAKSHAVGLVNTEAQTREEIEAEIFDILNDLIGLPEWDSDDHIITFTARNGSVLNINLPLEDLVQDIDYDPDTKEIIIVKKDGTEIRIAVSDLIDIYEGSIGAHIQIAIEDNVISAILLSGTVGESELKAALLAKINGKINSAEKGQPNGVATLDQDGKLDSSQFPDAGVDLNAVANYLNNIYYLQYNYPGKTSAADQFQGLRDLSLPIQNNRRL